MKRGNYGNSGATLWHLLSNLSWPKLKQLTNWKAEPPLDLWIAVKKQHWKIIGSPFAMPGVSNVDGWARSFSFSLKIVVLLTEQTNFFPETISQWCSSSKHKKAIHWIFFNQFFVHAIGHKDEVLWMTNLILNISYFVDVNQVHYFPYVFYTCIAGNCIVDKNCLFFTRPPKDRTAAESLDLPSIQVGLFRGTKNNATQSQSHFLFFNFLFSFPFFWKSRTSRASPRTNFFLNLYQHTHCFY